MTDQLNNSTCPQKTMQIKNISLNKICNRLLSKASPNCYKLRDKTKNLTK
ncbi:unnamed protein product [Arabidopsis halleri]